MRPNAAGEEGVAVVQQVVCCDGGRREAVSVSDILRGFPGGDVLKDDFQLREIAAQRNQLLVNEHRFAVKQINIGAGDLTMDQQQQASLLHSFQRFVGLAQVGHAGVAVGRGTRRVKLERHHAGLFGALNLLRRQVVGQVQRHQRFKLHTCWHCRQNAAFISQRLRRGSHRRPQVRHDDGPAKLGRCVRHHRGQRVAVAHVQMPVVRAGDGEGCVGD